MDKIINVLKHGDFKIPYILFINYKKLKLKEAELIIIIYLLNAKEYNPKLIADDLDIKLPLLLEMIGLLQEKGILKVELKTINGIKTEEINLDSLYEKLALLIMKDEVNDNQKQSTIYDVFEKELGRTLSPMEYEIVNEWLNDNSEEILLLALKEATYNGVSNFRYIDRIVHEWNKKGIKTKDDVIKNNQEFNKNKKVVKQALFDYDWLNDNDN